MKLKHIIPQLIRSRRIRQFGHARLVRLPDGQHQLIGGSDADRAAAFEWATLFAHEIVFAHFDHGEKARCLPRTAGLERRLQPSL
jgi:hypothetical protein